MHTMRRLAYFQTFFGFIGLTLAGCASGAKVLDEPSVLQTPPPGRSTIVVYRTQKFQGVAIQPLIKVDGKTTGRCNPNGAFFVDVEPGRHTVTAQTESTAETVVDTSHDPISYVECSIGIGVLVGRPKLVAVTPLTGQDQVRSLVNTGRYSQ